MLPKWSYNEEFLELLSLFVQILPLAKKSHLCGKTIANKILLLSNGMLDNIIRIIKLCAIDAIKTGKEKITLDTLNNIQYIPYGNYSNSNFAFNLKPNI